MSGTRVTVAVITGAQAVCRGPIRTEFFAIAGAQQLAQAELTGVAAGRVVALALRDLLTDRAVSHAGIGPGVLARLAGVLPRGLLVRAAGRRNLRRGLPARTGSAGPSRGSDAV